MAERYVQTCKNIFKKALDQHNVVQLVLLQYRNMPICKNLSPAKIFMSRSLRQNLPITDKQLKPKVVSHSKYYDHVKETQSKQKQQFDKKKGVKVERRFNTNDHVYVQIKPKSNWQKAQIREHVRDRT